MIIEIKLENGNIVRKNTKHICAFGERESYFFTDKLIFRKEHILSINYIGDGECQNSL